MQHKPISLPSPRQDDEVMIRDGAKPVNES